jgi:hypothetical protein
MNIPTISTCRRTDDDRCSIHGGQWDFLTAGCQTTKVLLEVREERARQFERYGSNADLQDGTGPDAPWLGQELDPSERLTAKELEAHFRSDYVAHEQLTGAPTWMHLIREEVAEAFMEKDPVRLRAELLQVAALAVSWVEKLDTREPQLHLEYLQDIHLSAVDTQADEQPEN